MTKEYKTVCDKCGRKTWYDTEQQCHYTYNKIERCDHCGHAETLQEMERCTGTLRLIDNSELDPRLTPFYERGERVEITELDGTKNRFWVGKSTGWKPCYLEIKKINSSGGSVAYIPIGATIRGTGRIK